MKHNKTKKALIAQYKEREIIGGVYVIKNTRTNKLLPGAALDLQRVRNRFAFSQQTGSCVDKKLQKDWDEQGGEQFALEILEQLKKGDTQSMAAFKADIEVLKKMWLDKLSGHDFY